MIERPDAKLDFGTIDLSGSATELSNVLNLGKTNAAGLFVGLNVTTAGAGGTSVVFTVKGSSDGTNYTDLASVSAVLASGDLAAGKSMYIGIPRGNESRYLKVAAAKTGTFTAGVVGGYIDTYTGK